MQTTQTGDEDTQLSGSLTGNDPDGLTDGTLWTVSQAALNGSASIDAATGVYAYDPTPNYFGSDSFEVTLTDDQGDTTQQVVTLTVTERLDLGG